MYVLLPNDLMMTSPVDINKTALLLFNTAIQLFCFFCTASAEATSDVVQTVNMHTRSQHTDLLTPASRELPISSASIKGVYTLPLCSIKLLPTLTLGQLRHGGWAASTWDSSQVFPDTKAPVTRGTSTQSTSATLGTIQV